MQKSIICKTREHKAREKERGLRKRERISRERDSKESQGQGNFNRKVLFPRELQAIQEVVVITPTEAYRVVKG